MTLRNLLIMQENEFSGTISMYPSTMQQLCTHVDKLVLSNFQICFSAPYLSLHAKYSHMPNMPRGRTSPGLPYRNFRYVGIHWLSHDTRQFSTPYLEQLVFLLVRQRLTIWAFCRRVILPKFGGHVCFHRLATVKVK